MAPERSAFAAAPAVLQAKHILNESAARRLVRHERPMRSIVLGVDSDKQRLTSLRQRLDESVGKGRLDEVEGLLQDIDQAKEVCSESAASKLGQHERAIKSVVSDIDSDKERLTLLRRRLDQSLQKGLFDEVEKLRQDIDQAKGQLACHRHTLQARLHAAHPELTRGTGRLGEGEAAHAKLGPEPPQRRTAAWGGA